MRSPTYHTPVMCMEALEGLAIDPAGCYLDLTFGGGGHSRAILQRLTTGRLVALDQDADAAGQAACLEDPRFTFVQGNFRYAQALLASQGISCVAGVLVDLGLSSHQLDTSSRGFSARLEEGPLDMRMQQEGETTAAKLLHTCSERELIHIFKAYGELHNAPRVARAILHARKRKRLVQVSDLKEAIKRCLPPFQTARYYAQLFQALRIAVNEELAALEELLEQLPALLQPGGRLVTLAYHSLEDRLIKRFIRSGNTAGQVIKDLYGREQPKPLSPVGSSRVMRPTQEEVASNPRARSAKMRWAERLPLPGQERNAGH